MAETYVAGTADISHIYHLREVRLGTRGPMYKLYRVSDDVITQLTCVEGTLQEVLSRHPSPHYVALINISTDREKLIKELHRKGFEIIGQYKNLERRAAT